MAEPELVSVPHVCQSFTAVVSPAKLTKSLLFLFVVRSDTTCLNSSCIGTCLIAKPRGQVMAGKRTV